MRHSRSSAGCLPWLAAAVALGFADWYPWLIPVAAVIILAGWWLSRRGRE